MNAAGFGKVTAGQSKLIARFLTDQMPAIVVRKTLRFIDGNFRAQGWQGAGFERWKANKRKGTILVLSGKLRRGNNYRLLGGGQVKFYNNVKYSGIHNQGGWINTTANVKAHSRRRFEVEEISGPRARKARYKKMQTGVSQVRSHQRKINVFIDRRQYAPYQGHESPVLNKSIVREIENGIKKILTRR